MCNFLSAIVMKNGDVLWHPMIDSHSELAAYHKLRDDDQFRRNFAKVELLPGDDWMEPEKWTWEVDEPTRPDWLDDVEDSAKKRLITIAKGLILDDGNHPLIVDGCWIIGGVAKVERIKYGRVMRVSDSAEIGYVSGSVTIGSVSDSVKIGKVSDSATIGSVSGSVKIGYVFDSATIGYVSDSAEIGGVCDSAKIGSVSGSAKIGSVSGSVKIGSVYDSATIRYVFDSAEIGCVCGSAKIGCVCDSAKIGGVYDSATIGSVYDSATIGSVSGSAKIKNDHRKPAADVV